jgi:hypothetical protein
MGHHGGHSFNGKVTVEALMVAFSHSHAPSFSSFGHVDSGVDAHSGMPDHGHLGGWSTGDGVDHDKHATRATQAFLRAVEEAKNDPMRRLYGVHVVSHGYVDLARLFPELATKLGAIRVCGTTGNFYPTDVSLNDLTDWAKFSPPYARTRPPAGWYAKALGVTHVWRQYWQVPAKRYWWEKKPQGRPLFDRNQSCYLEVQIVTWFYASIGDYETRIDIKVVPLPVLDQFDKRWAIRGTPMKRHQAAAQGLADGLFEALRFARPTDLAKERRAKLVQLQTTKPLEVANSGADLDALFADRPDEPTFATPALRETEPAAPTVVAPSVAPAVTPAAAEGPKPTGNLTTVQVTIPAPVLRGKP